MSNQLRGSVKLFLPVLLALFTLSFLFTILGAQNPAAGSKTIDPCALLTKAEIQEILGKPVQDGKLDTRANAAVGRPCQYVVGDYGSFSILIKSIGPGETPDMIQAAPKERRMRTTSATLPIRTGGPQVPTPLVTKYWVSPFRRYPQLSFLMSRLMRPNGKS